MTVKKLIYGVGINDAPYNVTRMKNYKRVWTCSFYTVWHSMLTRCYDAQHATQYSAYKNCTVVKEWHTFTTFKAWMETQIWKNNELDKDIMVPGNKIYSPTYCCFVSHELNMVIHTRKTAKRKYPQGVSYDKSRDRYRADSCFYGKPKSLGRWVTIELAATAYNNARASYIQDIAVQQQNSKITKGLLNHADLIKQGIFL